MRLCLPSYQYPGTWLLNVEKLAELPWVEGIELLFFSFDADARKLFATEKDRVAAFSGNYSGRFFFSLHLPDPLSPADMDLVEMTAPFIDLYVVHPYRAESDGAENDGAENDGAKSDGAIHGDSGIGAWAEMVGTLRSSYGLDRFALEYTDRKAFEASRALLPGMSLCADTGCLIREGLSPVDWISGHEASIREIHLHAAREKKDHFPLSEDDAWVPELARMASRNNWIVNLETFSLEDSLISWDIFRRQLP